jgi:hypothetical protein
MALCLVAVLGLVSDTAYAADRGNISGNVLMLDGKPAVGFSVKLVKDVPLTMGRPGRGKGKSSASDSGAVGLQNNPGTKTVAQTTTDAQGRFTFNNVEVGQYRLEGGNRSMGWLYYDVSVEANKTTEMKDMKLVKVD